ncbi:hypothetical protein B7494_g7013 [Chlorociboria aeruginascens]|nr:hypothetical protein B7494_g7013 [Chlorociboria aeruginascens]
MNAAGMSPTSSASTAGKSLRYSCVNGVECVASAPAPPRRRKRKADEDLRARLKRCEELLKGYGAKVESDDGVQEENEVDIKPPRDISSGPEPAKRKGKLIAEHGMSRFLDNYGQLEDARDILQRSPSKGEDNSSVAESSAPDGSALLLFSNPQILSLRSLHPQPVQIFRLWQTFMDNVNPLSKLLHTPTVQCQILEATGNLNGLPRNTEALLFSIYTSAIVSLNNEDCEALMGESRSMLLTRYSTAAQHALVRVGFLKSSDMVVLQALVLFLLAVRHNWEPHSLWILTGVALRLAQRMGVHRDGDGLGIPIFEAEMRRRLWWQIMMLDGRSSQLAGAGASVLTTKIWDAKLPSNLNDGDLNPDMTEMPLEHKGQTEMIFCLITYEFCKFFQDAGATEWQNKAPPSLGDTDKWLDDLENRIESKFLRYCDPSIPLHFLSTAVTRSIISNKRLSAHHPRQYPDKGASMPQQEKDMLFINALQMIEYDAMAHSMKSMKRFLWHIKSYFQLDVFVFLLSELRHRPIGPLADRAWRVVHDVYKYHPELISDESNGLYVAMGSLTLLVWQPREVELARHHHGYSEVPDFISALRSQRPALTRLKAKAMDEKMEKTLIYQHASEQHLNNIPARGSAEVTTSFDDTVDFGNVMPLEMSPLDWDYWNNLLQEYELQATENSGQQYFG